MDASLLVSDTTNYYVPCRGEVDELLFIVGGVVMKTEVPDCGYTFFIISVSFKQYYFITTFQCHGVFTIFKDL